MDNIRVKIWDFGFDDIYGAVTLNPQGVYIIHLNQRSSLVEMQATALHELLHIINNDFFNGKTIAEIGDSAFCA